MKILISLSKIPDASKKKDYTRIVTALRKLSAKETASYRNRGTGKKNDWYDMRKTFDTEAKALEKEFKAIFGKTVLPVSTLAEDNFTFSNFVDYEIKHGKKVR